MPREAVIDSNSFKIDDLSPQEYILIAGAKLHNLKNIDVAIPRNAFTVVTGVSGSGKSSLAFDTLYAEGQRRYVESLSSYARQFLARMEKPEVKYIKGISPTVAIEQKVNTNNPRSTVATSAEIYELLKLLFARAGEIFHPKTGKLVKPDNVEDVVSRLMDFEGEKGLVYLPYEFVKDYSPQDLIAQGYSRARINERQLPLEEVKDGETFDLVIERFKVKNEEDFIDQISESIELAFKITDGSCFIDLYLKDKTLTKLEFSKSLSKDGIDFLPPDLNVFNFNSPIGACPSCEGFGMILGISEELVIPNKSLSVFDNAVLPWSSPKSIRWKREFIKKAHHLDFPIHTPYKNLTAKEKAILWDGSDFFLGINDYFEYIRRKLYKIQNRVLLSRYKGRTKCHDCKGSRLKKEALYIEVGGKNIGEINEMTIDEALEFFNAISLSERQTKIAHRIIDELINRLSFLQKVGVGYITLNRGSNTLSGGESQRINLAGSLGNKLTGATYILDEPSIGLHPKDSESLIEVLKLLNQAGNTVIVVEHDETIMQNAGYIIDIGPKAGRLGGEVVYQGSKNKMISTDTLTAKYLNKRLKVSRESISSLSQNRKISLKNSYKNNLSIDNVDFDLYALNVICGVSGSGKSTLVIEELVPEMKNFLNSGESDRLSGDLKHINEVEYVNQNPIGKSSRSNPATYVKAYDEIRNLYSRQKLSEMRGYKPGHFSLNVTGGRCEKCQGEGEITISMQFMADMKVNCEECNGKKFKDEVLEVLYCGKSISDVLELTIDEAIAFFNEGNTSNKNAKRKTTEQRILDKLIPLQKVGLGYVKLGQSSSTLSGGEAQRVKLAFYLIKGNTKKNTLFIFDEPTTGLHFHDINLLLRSFNELLINEHHIIVIEHNIDVIKSADTIIEIGPGGGSNGGNLIFSGNLSKMKKSKKSVTYAYL